MDYCCTAAVLRNPCSRYEQVSRRQPIDFLLFSVLFVVVVLKLIWKIMNAILIDWLLPRVRSRFNWLCVIVPVWISWSTCRHESPWRLWVEETFKSTCRHLQEPDPLCSLSDRTIRLATASIRGLSCRFTIGARVRSVSGRSRFKTKAAISVQYLFCI